MNPSAFDTHMDLRWNQKKTSQFQNTRHFCSRSEKSISFPTELLSNASSPYSDPAVLKVIIELTDLSSIDIDVQETGITFSQLSPNVLRTLNLNRNYK